MTFSIFRIDPRLQVNRQQLHFHSSFFSKYNSIFWDLTSKKIVVKGSSSCLTFARASLVVTVTDVIPLKTILTGSFSGLVFHLVEEEEEADRVERPSNGSLHSLTHIGFLCVL